MPISDKQAPFKQIEIAQHNFFCFVLLALPLSWISHWQTKAQFKGQRKHVSHYEPKTRKGIVLPTRFPRETNNSADGEREDGEGESDRNWNWWTFNCRNFMSAVYMRCDFYAISRIHLPESLWKSRGTIQSISFEKFTLLFRKKKIIVSKQVKVIKGMEWQHNCYIFIYIRENIDILRK